MKHQNHNITIEIVIRDWISFLLNAKGARLEYDIANTFENNLHLLGDFKMLKSAID